MRLIETFGDIKMGHSCRHEQCRKVVFTTRAPVRRVGLPVLDISLDVLRLANCGLRGFLTLIKLRELTALWAEVGTQAA